MTRDDASADRDFWTGVARAFGGAVFFSLPLLMTMEMWWLGFYMDRARLALLLLVLFPLLVALDHYSGFKETSSWAADVVDALVAYGVGMVAATAVLVLIRAIEPSMPLGEVVGKIGLQTVPASFGAVLAGSQFGQAGEEERRKETAGYPAELLFLTAGALFFSFNVAPTQEMIVIAYRLAGWQIPLLGVVTLAMMHAFVYAVEFRGSATTGETSVVSVFFRFTIVGYALALLVSAYILWTFQRFTGDPLAMNAGLLVVLGFPAGLGAAAARLIL